MQLVLLVVRPNLCEWILVLVFYFQNYRKFRERKNNNNFTTHVNINKLCQLGNPYITVLLRHGGKERYRGNISLESVTPDQSYRLFWGRKGSSICSFTFLVGITYFQGAKEAISACERAKLLRTLSSFLLLQKHGSAPKLSTTLLKLLCALY